MPPLPDPLLQSRLDRDRHRRGRSDGRAAFQLRWHGDSRELVRPGTDAPCGWVAVRRAGDSTPYLSALASAVSLFCGLDVDENVAHAGKALANGVLHLMRD